MKIKSIGWDEIPQLSQMPQINKAFIDAGHELVEENAQITYCHCSAKYEQAIQYKEKYPQTKLLLKLLDVPEHLVGTDKYDLKKIKEQLSRADRILAKSVFVQGQIKKFFDLDSYVIYEISKPIINRNVPFKDKTIYWLGSGRLNDENKRGWIYKQLEEKYPDKTLVTYGPNKLGNTFSCGIIQDAHVSDLYSISKFTVCMGKIEGCCLPLIQSIMAGSFPIVAEDLTTADEFAPKDFHVKPDPEAIMEKCFKIENNSEYYSNLLNSHRQYISELFRPENIIQNIINAAESVKL